MRALQHDYYRLHLLLLQLLLLQLLLQDTLLPRYRVQLCSQWFLIASQWFSNGFRIGIQVRR